MGQRQEACGGHTVPERLRHREYLPVSSTGAFPPAALANVVKQLKNRWFAMRNVYDANGTELVQPRCAMSYMRGPLTPAEMRQLRAEG